MYKKPKYIKLSETGRFLAVILNLLCISLIIFTENENYLYLIGAVLCSTISILAVTDSNYSKREIEKNINHDDFRWQILFLASSIILITAYFYNS